MFIIENYLDKIIKTKQINQYKTNSRPKYYDKDLEQIIIPEPKVDDIFLRPHENKEKSQEDTLDWSNRKKYGWKRGIQRLSSERGDQGEDDILWDIEHNPVDDKSYQQIQLLPRQMWLNTAALPVKKREMSDEEKALLTSDLEDLRTSNGIWTPIIMKKLNPNDDDDDDEDDND